MNLVEATGILTWISQTDGRVLLTEPNVQVWGNALQPVTFEEAKAAVLDHYRSNETVASPSGIRRAALAIRDRAVAKQTALTAGPTKPDITYDAYVKRMARPEYQAAIRRGEIEGNAERAYWTVLRETGNTRQATQASMDIRSAS